MSHKIKPNSYRLGINKDWTSRWFVKKNAPELLEADILIRKIVREKIGSAGIDKIDIERNSSSTKIIIKASKPGLVIGRGGKGIEDLTKEIDSRLQKLAKKNNRKRPNSINLALKK